MPDIQRNMRVPSSRPSWQPGLLHRLSLARRHDVARMFLNWLQAPRTDTITLSPKMPDYHLNATVDSSLLMREGQLREANRILEDLQTLPEKSDKKVTLELVVPDEAWAKRVETGVDRVNRLTHPKTLWERVQHRGLRLASGIKGEFAPIEYRRLQSREYPKLQLELNMSGLSRDDFLKVTSFIKKHQP